MRGILAFLTLMVMSQFITLLILQKYQHTGNMQIAFVGLFGAKALGVIYAVRTIYEGAFMNIVADKELGGTCLTLFVSILDLSYFLPKTIALLILDYVNYYTFCCVCVTYTGVFILLSFNFVQNCEQVSINRFRLRQVGANNGPLLKQNTEKVGNEAEIRNNDQILTSERQTADEEIQQTYTGSILAELELERDAEKENDESKAEDSLKSKSVTKTKDTKIVKLKKSDPEIFKKENGMVNTVNDVNNSIEKSNLDIKSFQKIVDFDENNNFNDSLNDVVGLDQIGSEVKNRKIADPNRQEFSVELEQEVKQETCGEKSKQD